MSLFVVTYAYVRESDTLNRVRPQRYAFFADLARDGRLKASGQLLDAGLGEGLLVLEAPDRSAAEQLLDADPFVREGLVRERVVVQWNPTAGSWVEDRRRTH